MVESGRGGGGGGVLMQPCLSCNGLINATVML